MKFLVPNYSCLQNPRLGGYRSQIPVLCPQLNSLNPPREQNSWVRHCSICNTWKEGGQTDRQTDGRTDTDTITAGCGKYLRKTLTCRSRQFETM